jgi:aspartate carbamoyltransferase regulatory subunit
VWTERNVKGKGCEDVDWIKLTQEKAFVNTIINLQILQKVGEELPAASRERLRSVELFMCDHFLMVTDCIITNNEL